MLETVQSKYALKITFLIAMWLFAIGHERLQKVGMCMSHSNRPITKLGVGHDPDFGKRMKGSLCVVTQKHSCSGKSCLTMQITWPDFLYHEATLVNRPTWRLILDNKCLAESSSCDSSSINNSYHSSDVQPPEFSPLTSDAAFSESDSGDFDGSLLKLLQQTEMVSSF